MPEPECPWPGLDPHGECVPRWRGACPFDPDLPIGHPDCPVDPPTITTTTTTTLGEPSQTVPERPATPPEVLPTTGWSEAALILAVLLVAIGAALARLAR